MRPLEKTLLGIGISSTILCIIAIVLATVLQSCHNHPQDRVHRDYEYIREVTVIDVNGDTVTIRGGATCHIKKKL